MEFSLGGRVGFIFDFRAFLRVLGIFLGDVCCWWFIFMLIFRYFFYLDDCVEGG